MKKKEVLSFVEEIAKVCKKHNISISLGEYGEVIHSISLWRDGHVVGDMSVLSDGEFILFNRGEIIRGKI